MDWPSRLALTAGVYFLCLWFLFPGYFTPTTPFHPDLFIGQGFIVRPHFWADALALARPAGFLAIRTMAELGLAGSLCLVIGVSLLNVTLMVRLVERVTGLVVSPILAAVYAALLFGQPEFYFNHRHDTLAVLSCCYLLLGWNAWYGFRETGRRGYLIAWALCAVLLCFTKETYWLAALLFCLWQVIEAKREQGRWALGVAAVLVAVMALALLHNRTANSRSSM